MDYDLSRLGGTFHGEEPLDHLVFLRTSPAGIHLDDLILIAPIEELVGLHELE
jgi:hypothetical protein